MKKVKEFFKDNDLMKIIIIVFLFLVVLTWIIPGGAYSGTSFVDYGYNRFGINDIFVSGVYAINYFLPHLTFLIVIGVFYGVLSKVPGYATLVNKVTKWMKGKEVVVAVCTSVIIAAAASMFTTPFALLVFIPFIITVFTNVKFDKISAFCITFGSILIGLLGSTVNNELLNVTNYLSVGFDALLFVKVAVILVALILFNFFAIGRFKNSLKDKKAEVAEDMFVVEDTKSKAKAWPVVVIFAVIAILQVLAYVDWNGVFGIEVFNNFHTWLMNLSIGEFEVFASILGQTTEEAIFGTWDLFTFQTVLLVATVIFAFMAGRKETLNAALNGAKKMLKPVLMVLMIYCVLVVVYWTPFTSTIYSWILGLSDKFNVFITSIVGLIAGLFNPDYSLTGMQVGSYFASAFGDYGDITTLVLTATNGLMKMFTPVSVFLMIGLSYLGISYKSWFKYIWKFVVGMLVMLLIIFALITYM